MKEIDYEILIPQDYDTVFPETATIGGISMKKIKRLCSALCVGMILFSSNSALNAGSGTNAGETAVKGVKIGIITASVNGAIGKQYQWGAAGPQFFDCSGLAWYAYHKNAGIDLGTEQCSVNIADYLNGEHCGVPQNALKPLDIIFYDLSSRNDNLFKGVDHVSIYFGERNKTIVEARPNKGVVTSGNRREYGNEVFWARVI